MQESGPTKLLYSLEFVQAIHHTTAKPDQLNTDGLKLLVIATGKEFRNTNAKLMDPPMHGLHTLEFRLLSIVFTALFIQPMPKLAGVMIVAIVRQERRRLVLNRVQNSRNQAVVFHCHKQQ